MLIKMVVLTRWTTDYKESYVEVYSGTGTENYRENSATCCVFTTCVALTVGACQPGRILVF